MTEPIIQIMCYAYQKYKRWLMLAFNNIYHPIGELLFFFVPSILISIILWIGCISFYLTAWIIWWMMFLQSCWKLLAASGCTISEILQYLNPNPGPHINFSELLAKLSRSRTEVEADMRASKVKSSKELIQEIHDSFFAFNKKWYQVTSSFRTQILFL